MKNTSVLSRLLVVLLPMLLAGCTRMKVTTLSDTPLPELPDWRQVDAYQHSDEVSESFQEIGVVEVKSAATIKKLIRDCQRQAASMGANGIVLAEVGRHSDMITVFTGSTFFPIFSDSWMGRVSIIRVD